MKTTITAAVLVAMMTGQAVAGPKPVKGKYKCSGSRWLELSYGYFTTGTKTFPIKAKMAVKKHQYAIDILTTGHEVTLDGYFPQRYSQNFDIGFGASLNANKGREAQCLIREMHAKGDGAQNKNGRKVSLDIDLSYFCVGSTLHYSDRYQIDCKR